MLNQKQCLHCGTTFEGRSNRLYCSDACKQRAFQLNQQATTSQSVTGQLEQKTGIDRKLPKGFRNDTASVKAEVELARLKFASEEKLKVLEAEERQRERQHELIRQEREFEQEAQRADANQQATKQAWANERKELLQRLDGVESRLRQQQTDKPLSEKADEDEETTQSSGLGTVLWLAGGALLLGLLSQGGNKSQTTVTLPQTPPKQPVRVTNLQPPTGLQTDAKTDL